jgi:hypothetical protein
VKKNIIGAFIAILAFCSFNASAQTTDPTVISTHLFANGDPNSVGISVTYSGIWTGTHGSTNPPLEIEVEYRYIQSGGMHVATTQFIIDFDHFADAAQTQPVYVGSFDPISTFIENYEILWSVPVI